MVMGNKTFLITGASRGIGNAIAQKVAHRAETLLVCSKNESTLKNGIGKIRALYDGCIKPYNIDQSKGEFAAKDLALWVKENVSSIDAVILCAGNFYEDEIETISSDTFEDTLNTNFTFNFYLIQNIIDILKRGINPRIILIGSTAAYSAYSVPTYGITKYALRGLAVNLRKEMQKYNIGVTFVSPGGTLTDMWADVDVPVQRLLDPEDIAIMVDSLFDLSPQAVVEELIIQPMLGDFDE